MAYTSAIQTVEQGEVFGVRLKGQLTGSSGNLSRTLAASEPPGLVGFVLVEVG